MLEPALRPISPSMEEGPVLVTVDAPRTPKVAAAPRLLACAPASRGSVRLQSAANSGRSIISTVGRSNHVQDDENREDLI
jgi:hypothetical protein